MHSYDTGQALAAKRDNWMQLGKLFGKLGLSNVFKNEEYDRVLRCEDNAAYFFVIKLYEVFTQKKASVKALPTVRVGAGYAQQTGSWRVKSALKHSGLDEDKNLIANSRLAADVVQAHEKMIQYDKTTDRSRYTTMKSKTTGRRTNTKLRFNDVPQEENEYSDNDSPTMLIKEVSVKQVDRDIANVRYSRQSLIDDAASSSPTARQPPGSKSPVGSNSNSRSSGIGAGARPVGGDDLGADAIDAMRHMLAENSSSILNTCISRVVGPDTYPDWNISFDALQNLFAILDSYRNNEHSSDGLICGALREIQSTARQIAASCCFAPKQFWKVSELFVTLLFCCPVNSNAYIAAVDCFSQIGLAISLFDHSVSLSLFCDFSLNKLVSLLHSHPHKRIGIMQILVSFAPSSAESHVLAIKKLHDALSGSTCTDILSAASSQTLVVFVSCLSVLATFETFFDPSLMDMYTYYSVVGLSMPSPRSRAAALSILSSLYPHTADVVTGFVPKLLALARSEAWWEVKAELLKICALNLKERHSVPSDDWAMQIVLMIFHMNATKQIKLIGISALSTCTTSSRHLRDAYLKILMSLPEIDRKFFLVLDSLSSIQIESRSSRSIDLPTTSGAPWRIDSICDRWHPQDVCEAFLSESNGGCSDGAFIESNKTQFSEVLLASVTTAVSRAQQSGASIAGRGTDRERMLIDTGSQSRTALGDFWVGLYRKLKEHIFAGLTDERCAVYCSEILASFIRSSSVGYAVLREKRVLMILKALYPTDKAQGNKKCQKVMENFLRNAYVMDDDEAASAVLVLIEQFAKSCVANYEVSNLQSLLREFSSL
jgi:hypothetical protein